MYSQQTDRPDSQLNITDTTCGGANLSLLSAQDSHIFVQMRQEAIIPKDLGFHSDETLRHLFQFPPQGGGTEMQPADRQSADLQLVKAEPPSEQKKADEYAAKSAEFKKMASEKPEEYAKMVQELLDKNTMAFQGDINRSNELMQVPRAMAAFTLRAFSLGLFDGTGICQHKNWQKDIPARSNVLCPSVENGVIQLGPKNWKECFTEVQEHKDQLNRKWGNCSEQAASMCHVLAEMIKGDPALAQLKVRQAYSSKGHSWAEVQCPDGTVRICDPWGKQSGKREDLKELREHYDDENAKRTKWYGRE